MRAGAEKKNLNSELLFLLSIYVQINKYMCPFFLFLSSGFTAKLGGLDEWCWLILEKIFLNKYLINDVGLF